MASTCMSNCINDINTRIPIRPTYVNLYKWPESDAEFVRSLSSNGRGRGAGGGVGGGGRPHPRVVDSISCRQMYLRSYTFHRNDQTDVEETGKTKCFGRVKEKAMKSSSPPRRKNNSKSVAKKKHVGLKRAKEFSCAALLNMFRRLLACTTKVDVADHHGG